MHKTFKHSGDMGDIVYSLPTIKLLGGGVLYLDVTGGEDEILCKMQCIDGKTKFNKTNYDFIKPLLEAQEYIKEVKIFNGEKIDYNLNNFRSQYLVSNFKNKNLLDLHLDYFGLPEWDHNEGWLEVSDKIVLNKKTLVSRSPRMQANYTWFEANKFNFRDKSIFIGLPKEHDIFEYTFSIKMDYRPVSDALEIAKVIKGCKAFVANSTFTLAVAIGLGTVPIVQEVVPDFPVTVFKNKKNMAYI